MTSPGAGVQPPGPTDGASAAGRDDRGPAPVAAPAVSLPKGGGAIKGIGEKFAANPVTATGSTTIPIETSTGRSGFGPRLALTHDSGAGNGPFGFGWSQSLPAITRKTDKGLPQYQDAQESDVYVLSGAEDLVPVLKADGTRLYDDTTAPGFVIHHYRPRIEGLFSRIERWTRIATGEIHWRSITRDNVTTVYGKDSNSGIFDPGDPSPANPSRIFCWLICESYDDKGNAIVYEYAGSLPGVTTKSALKGDGAIRGIGEKFVADLGPGSGSLSVPVATNARRAGFGGQLAPTYDSGSNNSLLVLTTTASGGRRPSSPARALTQSSQPPMADYRHPVHGPNALSDSERRHE